MTEQVEKTDSVQPILDKLTEYLSAAERLVIEQAPDVWQATLSLIQIKAIFSLTLLIVSTVVVVVCLYFAVKRAKQELKKGWTEQNDFIIVAPNFVGCIALAAVLICWLNSFELWLGAFAPELAVLHQIASKFGLL